MTTRVRFELTAEDCNRVYNQPIYYLAENYRQRMLKPELVEKEKIDSNLKFMSPVPLQIHGFYNDKIKNKTQFKYVVDKFTCDIIFSYKDVNFTMKPIECGAVIPIYTDVSRMSNTLLTYYEISFSECDIAVFEEFLKTAITYREMFLEDKSDDKGQINIYANPTEGSYFEFIGSRLKRPLKTIYLPSDVKKNVVNDITHFFLPATQARYTELGILKKRIYLFEGVPGAGKTSFIFALASHFDYDVAIISFGPKFTDTDMTRLLRGMNTCDDSTKRKKFLVLEDMDCIFKERKSNDEARNNVSFSGLLNMLDGFATPDGLICFITTNYKQHLDSALLRPGRVDYIATFGYVLKEQIIDMFTVYMNSSSLAEAFYAAVKDLRIRITFSLLQQYLLKYLDKPAEAIENVESMKKMYDVSTIDKLAEDTGLFS